MLAKKTVKNQITLPKKIADRFPRVEYFDVRTENDRIILEPLKADRGAQVREKLARLKLTEADIAKAVAWSRKSHLQSRWSGISGRCGIPASRTSSLVIATASAR